MSEDFIQVVCGQCSGQMRVAPTGEAVVCPHCESHLRVPANAKSGAVLQVETSSGILERTRSGESSAIGGSSGGEGISRRVFLLVASYASAVTIAFLWLLFQQSATEDPLESLPDIRPLNEDEFHFVGFDKQLPEGHTLRLGETTRFGDVKMTPIRVTRTPIEFAHYLDRDAKRDPTGPVLKLWMKFENVTQDVAFQPFGAPLMSRRAPMPDDANRSMANSFLFTSTKDRTAESVLLNYEHPEFSEWNIVRQPKAPLEPGQEYSTFVACSEFGTETAMQETDDLIWRVQIRKGIHRETSHGVTTLVDVVFSPGDVEQIDPPEPKKANADEDAAEDDKSQPAG